MKQTKQNGIAILEAMIAILIFSMGIIALMGMQATTINNVADAKYRNTASFYADQMVGMIWAKRTGSTVPISGVYYASPDTSFACNPCSSTNGNADTQAWLAQIQSAVPSATASIAASSVSPLVTVTVGWTPPNAASHVQVAYTYIN